MLCISGEFLLLHIEDAQERESLLQHTLSWTNDRIEAKAVGLSNSSEESCSDLPLNVLAQFGTDEMQMNPSFDVMDLFESGSESVAPTPSPYLRTVANNRHNVTDPGKSSKPRDIREEGTGVGRAQRNGKDPVHWRLGVARGSSFHKPTRRANEVLSSPSEPQLKQVSRSPAREMLAAQDAESNAPRGSGRSRGSR